MTSLTRILPISTTCGKPQVRTWGVHYWQGFCRRDLGELGNFLAWAIWGGVEGLQDLEVQPGPSSTICLVSQNKFAWMAKRSFITGCVDGWLWYLHCHCFLRAA